MSANYCRRPVGADRLCMGAIRTPNALEWCDVCRERLPLWPSASDVEPCRHCGFVGRGHIHTKPPEPEVTAALLRQNTCSCPHPCAGDWGYCVPRVQPLPSYTGELKLIPIERRETLRVM